jgi:hypothetical protein
LAHEGELYVQAQSQDRVSKERAMRRRRLRKLWNRLCELQKMKLNTKALLIKIGEAKKRLGVPSDWPRPNFFADYERNTGYGRTYGIFRHPINRSRIFSD